MSAISYILMGISARLPKKVFLPMVLFLLWRMTYGMPLPLILGWAATLWLQPLLQILLGLLGMAVIRRSTKGGTWYLAKTDFEDIGFSATNTLVFNAATLFLIIPGFVLHLVFSLHLTLDHFTAGFFHLDMHGLHTEERIYAKGDKSIHLIGMMHIGESDFYRSISESFPEGNSIILHEGISDRENLISSDFSYNKIAAALGLDTQSSHEGMEGHTGKIADVDASEFSPATIKMINATAIFLQSETISEKIEASHQQNLATFSTKAFQACFHDLLHMRNQHLLTCVKDSLEEYDTVVIPWGVAHMPGVEEEILKEGFVLTHTRKLSIVNFDG